MLASPYDRLAAGKQTESVDSYIDDFVARAAQVPQKPNLHYIGYFFNGLCVDVRVHYCSYEITYICNYDHSKRN